MQDQETVMRPPQKSHNLFLSFQIWVNVVIQNHIIE